jgi:hypothetical protein
MLCKLLKRKGVSDMAFDVKKRKRELIKENVKNVPEAAGGELLARILVLTIFAARAFLIIFELIFCSSSTAKISVWSYVLFLPFILIVYMIYDGNKSFVAIPTISAPIRLIYHFSAVLPSIEGEGVSALTVITVIVLAIQFFASIVMSANTKCAVYFSAMQKVNFKIRSEMLGGKK